MYLELNWQEAQEQAYTMVKMLKAEGTPYNGCIITRPDGHKVKITYYPISDSFRVARDRKDGKWGSSKACEASTLGWIRAIQHLLPLAHKLS